ncbi:hypothetical protein FJZ31_18405 [Candidatus Poribacteria bacterium]|nr:hypothetical protein [Candidatus Poribacteria bacterium]
MIKKRWILAGGVSFSAAVVLALALFLAAEQRDESQVSKPQLTSPANRFEMTEELTELTWNAVTRARFYGVEIVAVEFRDKEEIGPNTPRIWGFTVADKTFLSIDPLDYQDGEYQWSVAPFSDMMLMGPFSEPRTFIVRKQIKGDLSRKIYLADLLEGKSLPWFVKKDWEASNQFTLRKRTFKYGTAFIVYYDDEFRLIDSLDSLHRVHDLTWEPLSGEWALLESEVGVADQYPSKGSVVVTFEVTTLDGRVRSYKTDWLKYGSDSVKFQAPMKDAVRLRIRFTANLGDDNEPMRVVLGDPVLIPPKR